MTEIIVCSSIHTFFCIIFHGNLTVRITSMNVFTMRVYKIAFAAFEA